jgi:CubicO group peptidase (beta-lactamase class C family)
MKYLNKLSPSIFVVLLFFVAACAPVPIQPKKTEVPVENNQSSQDEAADAENEVLEVSFKDGEETPSTYFPGDEWQTSTPEEQGIDSALLLQMFQKTQNENIEIHSFLLVRNGYLVTEAYLDPYPRDRKHPVYSVTKSVISMLTGIAMEEGLINSVGHKVLDFFPDITRDAKGRYLSDLTLEHLLTMSAGYNTRTIPYAEALAQKDASFDTVEHILTYNSILYKPGTTFYYDSGLPHLLSAIIQETTGKTTQEYAQEKLFDPLGISGITWQTDPRGIPLGCTGLELSPRDMAKLGYLYLNRGQWNGEQIVSAEWVEKSTTKHIETKGLMNEAEDDGYGYYWWMDNYGGYSAHGFGGQYIFVVPNLNLVAVFTGALPDPVFPTPRKLMEEFVLPAVQSNAPLPPTQATSDLKAYTAQLENPPSQPVTPLPDTAKRISGHPYQITESPGSYFQELTLTFTEGQNLYQLAAIWSDARRDKVLGGLDDRFYVNEAISDGQVIAAKGYWQDENTFVETLKNIEYMETFTQKYIFEGNKLTLDISSTAGYSIQMLGEMIETPETDAAAAGSTRVAEIDGMCKFGKC